MRLDLFSISQTKETATTKRDSNLCYCENGAPYIAYEVRGKKYAVTQGNCNSWTCARCGPLRAKKEYGRIVHGATELQAKHKLHFLTITTRGSELHYLDAIAGYLGWTNRLLTALRTHGKRNGKSWHYASVTEFQKRGHPHSHFITTYDPGDLKPGTMKKFKDGAWQEVEVLRSKYIQKRVVSAGLGRIYDISEVREAEAASRYVAKYLFKPSMLTDEYPKNWRRVRYSRSWPKLPEQHTDKDAFVLLNPADWSLLSKRALVIRPEDENVAREVVARLTGADVVLDLSRLE